MLTTQSQTLFTYTLTQQFHLGTYPKKITQQMHRRKMLTPSWFITAKILTITRDEQSQDSHNRHTHRLIIIANYLKWCVGMYFINIGMCLLMNVKGKSRLWNICRIWIHFCTKIKKPRRKAKSEEGSGLCVVESSKWIGKKSGRVTATG